MNVVLGYSGLNGSAELLAHRADLSASERRVFQGMDAAAALLVDGKIVAAVQEERFSGRKFDHQFPVESIRWCLAHAGLRSRDVDHVAHGFAYGPYERLFTADPVARERFEAVQAPGRQQELLIRHFPEIAARTRVIGVRHHEAHAFSAVAASPFKECLAIVADGMGEVDAISVFRWRNGVLTRLATQDARSSLGLFYSLITMHLGYEPNADEYRVMALAAFGDPDRFSTAFEAAVTLGDNGRVGVPVLQSARSDPYREQYRRGRRWLESVTFPALGPAEAGLGVHADFAAAAQARLEAALQHVVSHWTRVTGLNAIALAGGVALNSVANGKLISGGRNRVFVQPAAGDEGTAVGAALAIGYPWVTDPLPAVPLLGPDLESPVSTDGWTCLKSVEVATQVAAELLARGAIIGWAQGRLEFGPRALGNRSILADPRSAATRDRVNAAVKFREQFRPLAPAVLSESADEWFELHSGTEYGHMTVVVPVRPERRLLIPAVTHVDSTARVQVVDRRHHPAFWSLLNRFAARTGVPVLLNTSLNVKGQPIARTAEDAFWTFENSNLDALFVNEWVITRGPWSEVIHEVSA